MTFHLPEELERFVHEAVRAGRYAREDDVICDALHRLKQALPEATKPPAKGAKRSRAVPPRSTKPLPLEELHRQMMASGLITSLPDPALDVDDDDPDDQPVSIKGEPLSETIIRERR